MIGRRGGALGAGLAILAIGAFSRDSLAVAKDPPAPIQVVRRADASLRGRVLDETRRPVADAQVRAYATRFQYGWAAEYVGTGDPGRFGTRATAADGATTTGGDGTFEIAGLEMDAFGVGVVRPGGGIITFSGFVAAPGGGPVVDCVLPATHGCEGDVRNADGTPFPNARVTLVLRSGDGGPWSSGQTAAEADGTGHYHVEGLPTAKPSDTSSSGTVTARTADRSRSAWWWVDATGRAPAPTLWLAGPATIEGTVTDESGKPVAGARVAAEINGGPLPRFDEVPFRDDKHEYFDATTTTDERGAFRPSRLVEGIVSHVTVAAPGYGGTSIHRGPRRNYRIGGVASLAVEDLWTVAGEPTRVDVHLRRGSSVVGTLTSPDGAPLSRVAIAACDKGTGLFVTATTGGDGTYRLDGIPWDKPIWGGDAASILLTDAPGWIPGGGEDPLVSMPKGSGPIYRKEVRLAPSLLVEGRVVDADGAPVAGAWVSVEGTDGRAMRIGTGPVRSGRDGSFLVPNLLPGALRLTAWHSAMKDTAKALLKIGSDTPVTSGVEIQFKTALPPAPGGG